MKPFNVKPADVGRILYMVPDELADCTLAEIDTAVEVVALGRFRKGLFLTYVNERYLYNLINARAVDVCATQRDAIMVRLNEDREYATKLLEQCDRIQAELDLKVK